MGTSITNTTIPSTLYSFTSLGLQFGNVLKKYIQRNEENKSNNEIAYDKHKKKITNMIKK